MILLPTMLTGEDGGRIIKDESTCIKHEYRFGFEVCVRNSGNKLFQGERAR